MPAYLHLVEARRQPGHLPGGGVLTGAAGRIAFRAAVRGNCFRGPGARFGIARGAVVNDHGVTGFISPDVVAFAEGSRIALQIFVRRICRGAGVDCRAGARQVIIIAGVVDKELRGGGRQ